MSTNPTIDSSGKSGCHLSTSHHGNLACLFQPFPVICHYASCQGSWSIARYMCHTLKNQIHANKLICMIGGLKFDIFEHDYFSKKYHRVWHFIHSVMRWRQQQHGHKAGRKAATGDRHHHRGNSRKRFSRGGRVKSVRFKTSNKDGTVITSSAATHGVVDSRHGSYLWMWVSVYKGLQVWGMLCWNETQWNNNTYIQTRTHLYHLVRYSFNTCYYGNDWAPIISHSITLNASCMASQLNRYQSYRYVDCNVFSAFWYLICFLG